MIRRLLASLFVNDLSGYQPRIVDLKKPITIVGMSVDTTLRRIYRDVPTLGRKFKQMKELHPIPGRKKPWAFAAVSKGYNPSTGAMTYMMGDVVTRAGKVPKGMKSFRIPAGKYAVFPVRPKSSAGWGLAIANAKGYAYTRWLPGSGYEAAGAIDDFELHDERSERKPDPEIDLYVAIRPRAKRRRPRNGG